MDKTQKFRIMLVEDHPIFREGVHLALTFSNLNCEIVAEVPNVRQAVDYIESHPNGIDIALLDFFLPDGNGGDVIKVLKSICPQAKILLITGEVNHPQIQKLAQDKAVKIISKDIQSADVTKIVQSLIDENPAKLTTDDKEEKTDKLSEREIEIIQLCVNGLRSKEIADKLNISNRTVEHHKERIFKKTGCKSVMELMKYAMQNGLV